MNTDTQSGSGGFYNQAAFLIGVEYIEGRAYQFTESYDGDLLQIANEINEALMVGFLSDLSEHMRFACPTDKKYSTDIAHLATYGLGMSDIKAIFRAFAVRQAERRHLREVKERQKQNTYDYD